MGISGLHYIMYIRKNKASFHVYIPRPRPRLDGGGKICLVVGLEEDIFTNFVGACSCCLYFGS